MEDGQVTFSVPTTSSSASADIVKNTAILDEGPRVCPLCNSVVKIYYVNYSSKIFMCENIECEYPFGEDFTIYESDDDGYFLSDLDMSSIKSKRNRSTRQTSQHLTNQSQGTSSIVSTSEWSEMAKIDHAYDSDESLSSKIFTKRSSRQRMEKQAKKQESEENIKQNVEKIKELNKLLCDNDDDLNTIRNEKWIKNLNSLQSSSGMRLLKDQELQKLKKTNSMEIGELKIDIESRQDSISSITIEIGNKDK